MEALVLRLFLFLAVWFLGSVFYGPSYAVWDYDPATKTQGEPENNGDDSHKLRIESLMQYCDGLSNADQPEKGCGCIGKAYKDTVIQKKNTLVQNYNYWVKDLNQAIRGLEGHSDPRLFGAVEAFCDRWYKDVEVVKQGYTRDKAAMIPKFKNDEERGEFYRENRELKGISSGLSERFCRAKAEIAAYDKLMKADPFSEQKDGEAYQQLKYSVTCRGRTKH